MKRNLHSSDSQTMKVCLCCNRIYRTEADFLSNTYRWRLGPNQDLYFNCSCNSTLIIKKGCYDWFSPEKTLSENALSIFKRLAIGDAIPKMSLIVMELQQLLDDASTEMADIVTKLKKEPMILADVLKIANLMRMAEYTKISTVEHAITYIGKRTLHDIVTAAAIRSFHFNTSAYSMREFWQEAFLMGCIAEQICHDNNILKQWQDETYLAACLANVGKVVYAVCCPAMADRIHLEASKYNMSWHATENSLAFPDHAIMGEIACAFWALPSFVINAAIHHHKDPNHKLFNLLNTHSRKQLLVVILASELKYIVLNKPGFFTEKIFVEAADHLGLNTDVALNKAKEYNHLVDKVNKIIES